MPAAVAARTISSCDAPGGDERAQCVVHDEELEDTDPAAVAASAVGAARRTEEGAGRAVGREPSDSSEIVGGS